MRHQLLLRPAALILASGLLALAPLASASAQVREPSLGYSVRVTAGDAPVFTQPDPRSALVARVRSSDLLVVVGKENAWYRVRVPRDRKLNPGGPDAGYVEAKFVAVVGPGGPPPAQAGKGGASAAAATRPQPGAQGWSRLQIRPFGEVAFQAFTASRSFEAIFGDSTGLFYGGGLDMAVSRTLRFSASVTYFQETGERAFVYNGEAFPMGITERVSMTPIAFNLVYRVPGRKVSPYVGGGAGAVIYRETSDFANASEDVNSTGTAFQVLGGVEFALGGSMSLAVEGQYQGVTGILGDSGVSQAYNEKDAGGFSVRARIFFGK